MAYSAYQKKVIKGNLNVDSAAPQDFATVLHTDISKDMLENEKNEFENPPPNALAVPEPEIPNIFTTGTGGKRPRIDKSTSPCKTKKISDFSKPKIGS